MDDFSAQEIEEIMQLVKTSAKSNLVLLEESLNELDFNKAQSICHKLVPLFKQLNIEQEDSIRMDINKNNPYQGWEESVKRVCESLQSIT